MFEPLYSAAEMRAAEEGHDVAELMERAGAAVAHEVLQRFPDARRIAVDTGAYASGTLTAARFEGEAVSFVPVRRPNPSVSAPLRPLAAAEVDWG